MLCRVHMMYGPYSRTEHIVTSTPLCVELRQVYRISCCYITHATWRAGATSVLLVLLHSKRQASSACLCACFSTNMHA
jgi:hypothetical protein